ncbi:MAG: UDP-N-acetylmuramoyl-L-alanyl-D-glutamate--2,6-diaminopimelate ligase, partial [bacterium]|nr:UDP-N-acetylmuramoyl-L-alanyl-D-glutamate--2,6-diaminopimelate ligase [bacterium]
MIKQAIKTIIPKPFLSAYHKTLAILANIIYGFPSRKMIVIGITGTKGKSSTAIMITRILEEAGHAVGATNTVFFKIAGKEWPNTTKQGMLGRFQLQKLLRQMANKKCTHAVIEVTSEGILQHRQWGISFDVAVFINLSPEHIESHGSYENYRAAKHVIFKSLRHSYRKTFNNTPVKKIIVANADDPESASILAYSADQSIAAKDTGDALNLKLAGAFMRQNAVLALATSQALGIPAQTAIQALEKIKIIPGRAEIIKTKNNITIVIDYAHEPRSFAAIHQTGRELSHNNNVISLFGATGGGRDKAKRPEMGAIAAEHADIIILTSDDPYDEKPEDIIQDIMPGITKTSPSFIHDTNLFSIPDRAQAIKKALALAKPNDVVLLLGKGSEQIMAVAHNKTIPWSDRA